MRACDHADQDEASRLDGTLMEEDGGVTQKVTFYESFFLTGELSFDDSTGNYQFKTLNECEMISEEGDKSKVTKLLPTSRMKGTKIAAARTTRPG